MSLVWDGFPGSGSELLAMLALADWSDDDGRCFPSMSAIAIKTRLSRSQAQRVVHGLIDGGFVEVLGNEFGGPPGATRQYRIVRTTLTGRMDATGSASATGRTHAQDGSHGCAETGRMGATQTVIEPSITVIHSSATSKKGKAGKTKAAKTPIPNGFGISEGVRKWAQAKGHARLEEHLEHFIGIARANGYQYADWDQAFMNAVRNDWARLRQNPRGTGNGGDARFEN
ncbi:helix-turn-helix domain-containing protein [Cupriavidus metallidurans]|uniref:helix-turn-helix domain-containing protein n=1 Tax=Cupriavidus metallidurans TaxID=119219 RepID=UPI001268AB1C|nr:helix-turn-helix domain-containing protein [Cupriavidus metallidurans]